MPSRDAGRYQRWCQATDVPLLFLSLVFLIALLVPLYEPSLPQLAATALHAANALLWVTFAVDYGVRLKLAPDRAVYVRGHLADLLTLAVPFLRPLRLLRVAGLLGAASRRAGEQALATTTAYIVLGEGVLVVVAAGLVLDAERGAKGANITTVQDALWWAATTVTTVGYGDRYPVPGLGRLVAVGLMVAGIALLGVVTASVAAWFVRRFSAMQTAEATLERDVIATSEGLTDLAARLERIERMLASLDTTTRRD